MKVLFVVGACLSKNTSANMSHNSYIHGLLENGCEVDVIMKNDSWGQSDNVLKKIDGVNYIEYESNSLIDKLRIRIRGRLAVKTMANSANSEENETSNPPKKQPLSFFIRKIAKKIFFSVFPDDKVYPLDRVWLSNASHFKTSKRYDLIISNSSPAASHKLAQVLIDSGNVITDRWIQIWEDPWFHDLYGHHSEKIEEEERNLLDAATEIYYVSPITTKYQKDFFPTAAHKMRTIALPYLDMDDNKCSTSSGIVYGYFGDYYSYTRNIIPFFNVMNKSGRKGYIYGDSNLSLKPGNVLDISPRVTLDVLKAVQEKTTVLVHLSNVYGGQIPGKIYHYSATSKPILFILDGTPDERELLKTYFSELNRYYFCDNTEESILDAMCKIEYDIPIKQEKPVLKFSPKEVVKAFL